jgi:hypothetical protein
MHFCGSKLTVSRWNEFSNEDGECVLKLGISISDVGKVALI